MENGSGGGHPSSILHPPSSSRPDGQIFAIYLMGYAVFRSLAEYFRGDYPTDHVHAGLTSAQVVSLPMFAAGLALMFILSRRAPKNEDGK